MSPEHLRLSQYDDRSFDWKHWGPYLAERAWGTVREDYSADGSAWTYFPHDHARSRVYRWNEDGLLGISDRQQFLCFALCLWNQKDPILKERLFGLSADEGNHGEDVKELYYYLDSTPTHSYMKALYKYPISTYPYEDLVSTTASRTRHDPEYEIWDTKVFDSGYWDITIEYAKTTPEDILIRITAENRSPETATLDLLPTLWFRNTWSWGNNEDPSSPRPNLSTIHPGIIQANHSLLGTRYLHHDPAAQPLFTENETNTHTIFNTPHCSPHTKDAIHRHIIHNEPNATNPSLTGTKVALHHRLTLPPGKRHQIHLRLTDQPPLLQQATSHTPQAPNPLGQDFTHTFSERIKEADHFYSKVAPPGATDDLKNIQRQALSGLLWSKQFYHYDVRTWLAGDPGQPPPPDSRLEGRNHDWHHLSNDSVMSMPDKWEYPWYAAWDLAFHCVSLAIVDTDFAKRQLILLLREWFMHPNGQVPAYEWALGDVNPPVHAWAALRVYRIEKRIKGKPDRAFLERVFHKLLINFTWWINRKDRDGRNLFQGGFLGLDNIGLFDRSATLPEGAYLDQCDGTSWMATYCLNMLAISLELASEDPTYEDVATKFLEHFFYIAHAINDRPSTAATPPGTTPTADLWDDEDGFYYDVLRHPDGSSYPLRVRSLVGLMPLLAVETIDESLLQKLPDFARRLEWFLEHRPELTKDVASITRVGTTNRRLFSVVNSDRLRRILTRVLDEDEFLSPHGLRSLSKYHLAHPVRRTIAGKEYQADYEPAESTTTLFGGNSNWRGPVWFPLNFLLIESLQKFDFYYGSDFTINCPTNSDNSMTLWDVGSELSRRLISLFERTPAGTRPIYGNIPLFQSDPAFQHLLLFHEYFHADTGAGLGANHQTGWTALVAKLIQQLPTRSRAD